jgi:putative transposase
VPHGLYRFQQSGDLHFVTFSCYRRTPLLKIPEARHIFEQTLEQVRRWYGLYIIGYVIMPEHVHLLLTEPERSNLAVALQMLKQNVAHKDSHPRDTPLWQPRYYDFNVWSSEKRTEKLKYLHRNPVRRGLVENPEDWEWSSYRHYATGIEGVVEIESPMALWRRRQSTLPLEVAPNLKIEYDPIAKERPTRRHATCLVCCAASAESATMCSTPENRSDKRCFP